MELKVVRIEKPDEVNIILGQSHFIKTVEDLHEALVNAVPGIKFGIAFCESSQKALVRWSGTDEEMIELAKENAWALTRGIEEEEDIAERKAFLRAIGYKL